MSPAVVSSNTIKNFEESQKKLDTQEYKWDIVWHNVVLLGILHIIATYTWLTIYRAYLITFLYWVFFGMVSGIGITAGFHRLWTHRSYKAKLPLRIILMLCATAAGQNTIPQWVRDHRVHHKFSETDADPHNSKRGFFFAHVGWLLIRKHPEVKRRGKEVDMSDVLQDPVVQFQVKYFILLLPLLGFILPTLVPPYLWGESWHNSILTGITRYVTLLNLTWFVNSAAHLWGRRPYDKRISPVENVYIAFFAFGEGWHNYHHLFPWDYKAAELSYYLNPTTYFIELFTKIGWAYDLKTVSPDVVKRVVQKYGDGSHFKWGKISEIDESEENVDITQEQ